MLCFFSPGCKYCKLSAQKISLIFKRHALPENRIVYIFRNNSGNLDEFYSNSDSYKFSTCAIDSKSFFRITGGRVPLILLVDGKDVYAAYNYRTIREGEVADFLGP
jgi:hypothetical protein